MAGAAVGKVASRVPITAIIVNFNAGELLEACVRALLASTVAPRILVIDNASTDNSGHALRERLANEPAVEVRFNTENLGFARAVNQGLQACLDHDVLVLNPDCLVEPSTLELLAQALADDDRAALAAPLVLDAHGRPERSALRRFPSVRRSLFTVTGLHRLWPGAEGVAVDAAVLPAHTVQAEAVSGACMLLRRSAVAGLGGFDDAYGMHCEDLDLMFRLRAAGWHCLFVPGARATHHQGRSSRSRPLWVHYQKHLGMRRFYRKFQAPSQSWLTRLVVQAGIWLHFLALAPLVLLRR